MKLYRKEILEKILPKETMEQIEREYYMVQITSLEPKLRNKRKRQQLIKKILERY